MFFWADPNALAHRPQPECDEIMPHKVSECRWFQKEETVVNDTQLEPTLEDLAIEAAMFLETLPTYVSDNTLCRAGQMAFALRTCVENHRATAAVGGEVSYDQIVQAITDVERARESHAQWANHLRLPHTFECQGCVDHASHIGDAEYHDEWIAKYDNVINVLFLLTRSKERHRPRRNDHED